VPAPGPEYASASTPSADSSVYFRTGLYKAPGCRSSPAMKRPARYCRRRGVTDFHPGDRVACHTSLGSCSASVTCLGKTGQTARHITYEQGAVLMLKGLTVRYLCRPSGTSPPSDSDPRRGRRDQPARLPMGERAGGTRHRPVGKAKGASSRWPMAAIVILTMRRILSRASNRSAGTSCRRGL
jgi:hypothetical protein